MTEPYTPTTEEVRNWYAHKNGDQFYASRLAGSLKAFDRWLASVLAEKDAEIARLRLVHAGQAKLALSAVFLADVDDDEGVQAFRAEYDRVHAVKVLRDAAGRIDASDAVRWLRAEAARLEQQNTNHNEREQR